MKYFTLLCLTFILIYGKVYAISFDALTHDFGTIYEEKGLCQQHFLSKISQINYLLLKELCQHVVVVILILVVEI